MTGSGKMLKHEKLGLNWKRITDLLRSTVTSEVASQLQLDSTVASFH